MLVLFDCFWCVEDLFNLVWFEVEGCFWNYGEVWFGLGFWKCCCGCCVKVGGGIRFGVVVFVGFGVLLGGDWFVFVGFERWVMSCGGRIIGKGVGFCGVCGWSEGFKNYVWVLGGSS